MTRPEGDPAGSSAPAWLRHAVVALQVARNVVIIFLVLVLVELIVYNTTRTHAPAERRHTRYDPDLGWVNEPNLHIADMYSPGVYFRTNSQGFRNNHDFDVAVPEGKSRIICSGDSFTLGFGVDNDHAWCQQLATLDPRLESMNMGQGGYGVDQAYLWYKRDGARFERQVHILAFITDNFYRMQSDTFKGYGKPRLDIRNGRLVVGNVPVPKRDYLFPGLTSSINNLHRLRTVNLLKHGAERMGLMLADTDQRAEDAKTREILRLLFADLKRHNEERSSVLVLLYLPTLRELRHGSSRDWLEFLEAESRTQDIPLINAFDVFRALPYADAAGKFDGHFTVEGNAFVARLIYDKLRGNPRTTRALSPRTRH